MECWATYDVGGEGHQSAVTSRTQLRVIQYIGVITWARLLRHWNKGGNSGMINQGLNITISMENFWKYKFRVVQYYCLMLFGYLHVVDKKS